LQACGAHDRGDHNADFLVADSLPKALLAEQRTAIVRQVRPIELLRGHFVGCDNPAWSKGTALLDQPIEAAMCR
jgi:hypothetical protein